MEKGHFILKSFWKVWRNDHLLKLRERSQIKLKSQRIESNESPKVGNIVQVNEDLPRGSWKIAKIVELIPNSDGNIRAAKLLLPTKNVISRPLSLLYPLECEMERNTEMRRPIVSEDEIKDHTPDESCTHRRTLRGAASLARDNDLATHL